MFTGNGPIAIVTIAALMFYGYTIRQVGQMRRSTMSPRPRPPVRPSSSAPSAYR